MDTEIKEMTPLQEKARAALVGFLHEGDQLYFVRFARGLRVSHVPKGTRAGRQITKLIAQAFDLPLTLKGELCDTQMEGFAIEDMLTLLVGEINTDVAIKCMSEEDLKHGT